jgi:hypothetical protein
LSKDTITSIARQFSSFDERFQNLESEAVFAIGQTIAIEAASFGTGWVFATAAKIAQLSPEARGAARLIGSWSVHSGVDGYFAVSSVIALKECNGSAACLDVGFAQLALSMLSIKRAAFETPEIWGHMKTILTKPGDTALADEFEPFMNGLRQGYETTSGLSLETESDLPPTEPAALTPTAEPTPTGQIGWCPRL